MCVKLKLSVAVSANTVLPDPCCMDFCCALDIILEVKKMHKSVRRDSVHALTRDLTTNVNQTNTSIIAFCVGGPKEIAHYKSVQVVVHMQ